MTTTEESCFYECGRIARAKGRCSVCYEYERRERQGKRVVVLEVLRLKKEVSRLRSIETNGNHTGRFYVIRHSDNDDDQPNVVLACETDGDAVAMLREVLPALQAGTADGATLVIAREVKGT